MRLSATRLTSIAQAGGGRTLIQRVISILRRFGSDAHIYLPGVGMLNGLTAGNYLDSAGTTAGTVDQPVGLVLDAAGGLGVELVVSPFTLGDAASIITNSAVLRIENGDTSAAYTAPNVAAVIGKTYEITGNLIAKPATGGARFLFGGLDTGANLVVGPIKRIFTASATNGLQLTNGSSGVLGEYSEWEKVSVREVTGIAASQPTTANKSVLKLTNGRYNWLFDSTDLLTATYPAGYESVTVIDARSTGQVTTAGANIVGAYSMGPSVTLYGRMIIRVAVSPSDLALLQGFANRLAGL